MTVTENGIVRRRRCRLILHRHTENRKASSHFKQVKNIFLDSISANLHSVSNFFVTYKSAKP
jgi:hypothetical protein